MVKYKHPSDDSTDYPVFVYIVKCALPSELDSGNYSPNYPHIDYDRTVNTVREAKLRQKELIENHGWQSFYTIRGTFKDAFY